MIVTLDPVATTSRVTAAMRAVESDRPDRLFSDPFAATLAGDAGRELAARMGAGDTIAVRTHFIDDGVLSASAPQLVLVAAGMDTRAWRLDLPAGSTVYEMDRPAVLDLKAHLLAGAATRAARVPVGADLTGDWSTALHAAGHDPDRPTCWVVEGLTQYLPERALLDLLDAVTARSAAGSHLLLDVVGATLLRDPSAAPLLAAMAAQGSPWIFATDDPAPMLVERGWTCEVRGFATYTAELGREAGLRGDELGFLVHATV
ncbi:class I SAM-dependent methyltransferase [Pseudonocardia sp. CA-107938]|uniref:class I SAM-dependent methyltransferase n=1 Tax=Pseudonocardia sp. CA-107938 TaxID=3240021 RepID=UPI003D8CCC87